MSAALFAAAALLAWGTVLTVASVGRPRKPTTPGVAAAVVVMNAFIVTMLVLAGLAAGRLHGAALRTSRVTSRGTSPGSRK